MPWCFRGARLPPLPPSAASRTRAISPKSSAASWAKHPAATAAAIATERATGSRSFLPLSDTFLLDRHSSRAEDTPSKEVSVMPRWLSSLLLLPIAFCLCAPVVDAQESASSGIAGQVLDASKAGIPGATVSVTHSGTNAQRVVTTDLEGRFAVPGLPPATYRIRVEISGFQP